MAGKLVVTAGAGLSGAVVLLILGIGLSGRNWTDSRHLLGGAAIFMQIHHIRRGCG